MCTQSCLDFVASHLSKDEVRGCSVLEVGALDVNGSARSLVLALDPASYTGVDMQAGPNVDEVCSAEELVGRYGKNRFDIVISTEMLEHVRDWRMVVHNLKEVLKPDGLLLLTTRSIGFKYHAYPHDYWRYQLEDMRALFSDYTLLDLMDDPLSPGVFVKARKPAVFTEVNLENHALYSMVLRRRVVNLRQGQIDRFHFTRQILEPFRVVERHLRHARKRVLRR